MAVMVRRGDAAGEIVVALSPVIAERADPLAQQRRLRVLAPRRAMILPASNNVISRLDSLVRRAATIARTCSRRGLSMQASS